MAAAAVAVWVRVSNGTWYIRNAPFAKGWPGLTPVGQVRVKRYPRLRHASVPRSRVSGDRKMFGTLYEHIRRRDIPMTTPVIQSYAERAVAPSRMGFLYPSPSRGSRRRSGDVDVHDERPRDYASVGLRGDNDRAHFNKGLRILKAWLARHPQWKAAGPARILGYNAPFVPPFLRYSEVQIPLRKR